MADALLAQVVAKATRAYSNANSVSGKVLSESSDATATELCIALHHRFGEEWQLWEPETLWKELGDIPTHKRDAILAVQALGVYPAFYWEPRVFGATCLAFDHEAVFARELPRPEVHSLAWGVLEAALVFGLQDESDARPHFDDDVSSYVATLLFDAGFAAVPEQLRFADEPLEAVLSDDGKELHAKVKAAWRTHPKGDLEADFEDSALGVQLARLTAVHHYCVKRLEGLRDRL